MTSVTSSTIISTTSSLFSFILSVCFTGEEFSMTKFLGVVFCMAGTVLVALSDSESEDGGQQQQMFGDLVCLFSAFMYSTYTVVIKHQVPDDDTVALPLLFGYLGALNAILLLPVVLILSINQPAMFRGLTPEVFGVVSLKGLFDNVLSDYLWARAVVLTSPTVATVGLSLTIPLAFVSDAVSHHAATSWASGAGALLVVVGFILVNLGSKAFEERCRRVVVGLCNSNVESEPMHMQPP